MPNKILWRSATGWTIERMADDRIIVADKYGWNDDPILYPHNDMVAYDWPERIPQYVKKEVGRIMRALAMGGKKCHSFD